MYEKTIIVGRLGRAPEMRYTQDGTPVTSFSVAIEAGHKDKTTGEWIKKTKWYRVTAWRKLAEFVNQYFDKGDEAIVEGEMTEPKPYQASDGTYKAGLELTAQAVRFGGSKREGGEQAEVAGDTEIPF